MPELPEVEIIRLGLQKKIIGLTIKEVTILNPKTFHGDSKKTRGLNVFNVWRRAKILGVSLTSGLTLLFHLKMTGQLIWVGPGKAESFAGGHPTSDMQSRMPVKSTRAIFEFTDGSKLYFNDQRKFGWVKLVKSGEIEQVVGEAMSSNLGPEPFDKGFSWEKLKENLLRHKNQPVKVAIMDQSVVAGVGNIYASEACFLAKIDPQRKVVDLADQDFKKLFSAVKRSLELAIKAGGSTLSNFVNTEGEGGKYLRYAKVYKREGQPCRGCDGVVSKITQAGRSTYFCPSCQK